ncbi:MAG: UDP-N-acetylmuramate--L-alanine ligase [Rhabdochlamydiaceae bacterium]
MKEQYHFIGIGGIGMSALAHILLQRGASVTGSDVAPSSMTDELRSRGAEIFIGHSPHHIHSPTVVVYSSDIREGNPEVCQAKSLGLSFLHRSELLFQLMEGYSPLLVTGTHGKTTTSSLLAHLLVEASLDPAYAVGGIVHSLNSNGGHGIGRYFVAEADESDGSFLNYAPFGAIITNIDNDHLAYWNSVDNLVSGFKKFANRVESTEHLIWCGDDETLRSLKLKGFSYGFGNHNDLQIENYCQVGWKNIFDVFFEGIGYAEIEIPLIGGHNVLNAAAVFALGIKMDIPEDRIRKAFANFKGVNRRAELKGEWDGITVFDDYAHHPTEIFATLRAIKQATSRRRLVVAFQPHRYTRIRDCLHEFGPALECVDLLILTDIYAAREAPIEGITNEILLAKIQEKVLDVRYIPRSELSESLARLLEPNDVLVTLGAGDITKVGPEVLTALSNEK